MPEYALADAEKLKKTCLEIVEREEEKESYQRWRANLVPFLDEVAAADVTTRESEAFQQRLWDDNPVSAVGQGTIAVAAAIASPEFRQWLATESLKPLPEAREPRLKAIKGLYDALLERLEPYCNRQPRLKVHRVLAAFFPHDFTTVTFGGALRKLHRAMGLPRGANPITRHAHVLERLEEVLGPPGDDTTAIAERMMLPWLLYARALESTDDESTVAPGDTSGHEKLIPLPASRRRRGLTGIAGGLPALLSILEFVRDGVTRDELKDHLRTVSPNLRESSINTQIYVISGEFGCIRLEDNKYVLSDLGEAFLETGDPEELSNWMLTRILGFDNVLHWLREEGKLTRRAAITRLQSVNPGWTAAYAPSVLLNWLKFLGAIEVDGDALQLTDVGKEWASRIHWVPQSLPAPEPESLEATEEEVKTAGPEDAKAADLPSIDLIVDRVSKAGHFPRPLIAKLHAGIWSHHRRHFAILTGLSGSGKTLLARAYAKALCEDSDRAADYLHTVAVQPGWYDPTALLGYVNPLRDESYVRTPFLEFLLKAALDPGRPYIAVLDEMNLSRPEQYLAPILSAMETGSVIHLHRQGAEFDGVPESVIYPRNLVLIGTVNMDETTHGLSDKVLDRAFTLEFWDVNLDHYPRWGTRSLSQASEDRARSILSALMDALRPARLHFAWRTVDDVLDFLNLIGEDEQSLPFEEAIDSAIYAKILPKLRGDDSTRVREALKATRDVLSKHGLSASHAKVRELEDDLELTGSARFWR